MATKAKSPAPKSAGLAGNSQRFLIAAIGASAGGIEAFAELMRHLPTTTGIAFVVIQHLDPKHHSILTELLSRVTKMPVREVTDKMKVEPNHVYVIPPNASRSLNDHQLALGPRGDFGQAHMPIDQFMRSLAEQEGNRAIGVILSGSGTDGTLGMAEIQAQGGVTFAQDEQTAKYDGMPHSAVAAGCVDYVLAPKGIALELARIANHRCACWQQAASAECRRRTAETGGATRPAFSSCGWIANVRAAWQPAALPALDPVRAELLPG